MWIPLVSNALKELLRDVATAQLAFGLSHMLLEQLVDGDG